MNAIKTFLLLLFLPLTLFSQIEIIDDSQTFVFVNESADFNFLFNKYEDVTDQNMKLLILLSKSCKISSSGVLLTGNEAKDPKFTLYEMSITKELLQKSDDLINLKVSTAQVGSYNFLCLVKSDQNSEIFKKETYVSVLGKPNLELIVEEEPIQLQLNEVSIQKIIISSTGSSPSTNAIIKVVGNEGVEPFKTSLNQSSTNEGILITNPEPIILDSHIKNYLISFQALKKGNWTVLVELTYDQTKEKKIKKLVFNVK